MNYLSVCSGIEAASVAWPEWTPVAFSEIEQFPCEVLSHHYPDVPNWGDMNDYQNWPEADVDVLVGGTPCQSFSVAGLRAGLDDHRGNLALAFCALAARYRPTWVVWENVTGVLSSNGGRDFGSILGALAELGYGLTYRVLDAQYVRVDGFARAVPQRRRRVFVIGHFGDWRRAAEVLFEPESLRGDSAPQRSSEQTVAAPIGASPADCRSPSGRQGNIVPEVCGALSDGAHKGGGLNGQDAYTGRVIPTFVQDAADPLTAHEGKTYTHEGKNNFRTRNVTAFSENQRAEVTESDVTRALSNPGGKPGQGYQAARIGMAVRRLTVTECERLMGFPDGYTDIPGAYVSHRYKALGNSMAVNVMRWIGQRIEKSEQITR